MDRRSFIKKSFQLTTAATSFYFLGNSSLFQKNVFGQVTYDLVAVKGGEPDEMFDKGIEALGGIKSFVWKGSKVIVKPNIGWDVPPERAGNTHPKLVAQIVKRCYEAGAKEVLVFDHTCDNWQKAYKNSGIENAVKNVGGKVVPANSDSYYQKVTVPNGKALKETQVHELILEADVFINVPILKNHSSAKLTMGMKNLMGIVWDRRYWHANDLHQCIADFTEYRLPDLNIIDAYYVMKRNGPRGVSTDDVVMMQTQLLSRDIVAIDSAGAKLLGYEPKDIPHIKYASEKKIGRMDLDKLSIKRISI